MTWRCTQLLYHQFLLFINSTDIPFIANGFYINREKLSIFLACCCCNERGRVCRVPDLSMAADLEVEDGVGPTGLSFSRNMACDNLLCCTADLSCLKVAGRNLFFIFPREISEMHLSLKLIHHWLFYWEPALCLLIQLIMLLDSMLMLFLVGFKLLFSASWIKRHTQWPSYALDFG